MTKQALLQKYFTGGCSPEELRQLYGYLMADEATDYDAVLRELWQQLPAPHPIERTTSKRIYTGVTSTIPALAVSSNRAHRPWLMMAATVSLLVFIGWLAQPLLFPSYVTHQTAYGEVKQIELPDGTLVDLNANSQLRVPARSSTELREAWLMGEAYFHVMPQKNADAQAIKFIVHTSNLDVEVLGTTFNVKDRRGTTDVVLSSGSVLLRKQTDYAQALVMQPGDRVRLHQTEEFVLTHVPQPIVYTSWKDHELYFDDQTLGSIQQELADSYNVSLRFADSTIANLRFTGSAPADDLTILLETIQKSFDLTLKQDTNGYLLIP
jgi:ferric-dicitrate binding protein FerR (iron transport regulator)